MIKKLTLGLLGLTILGSAGCVVREHDRYYDAPAYRSHDPRWRHPNARHERYHDRDRHDRDRHDHDDWRRDRNPREWR